VITLGIDPGPTESALCMIDDDYRPVYFTKCTNTQLLNWFGEFDTLTEKRCVIEWISSYGMPVGEEVFDTCLWVGRFVEALSQLGIETELIKRQRVKVHHCHSAKAKDPNITQALVDRFAPGQPNYGKGRKAEPGFFYGFYKDIWQAMALAVYAVDTNQQRETA
jgi:hypothetical protein